MAATVAQASNFPYANYRPGQREAIEAARSAFVSGKRFVIIEAPTGSGKSAIAVALAREAKGAFILTGQKLLQDQYLRDFADLAIIKGRANYPCLIEDTHAGAAPCLVGKTSVVCDECTYLRAKRDAVGARITSLNYAYFLAELNGPASFERRELLILDEAHNAEDALMRFVEVVIEQNLLERAGVNAAFPDGLDLEGQMTFALDLIPQLVRARTRLENELASLDHVPIDIAKLAYALETLLERLVWLGEGGTWVCDAERAVWRFRPVRVNHLAERLLFRHARRVLMLSATILDAETFLQALGIKLAEASFIRIGSSFPVQNRPILPLAIARLNRNTLETELPSIVQAVSDLLTRHPQEKGLIHAHSYRIARALIEHLPPEQQPRLIYHLGPTERDQALERHLTTRMPTVLITPSMTEGVDLAGDLARFQIIIKIPYPYLGDAQVAARSAIDPAWYEWRTALRLVQAYGRAVRGPEDHAVTYVLDALFRTWVRRTPWLPPWFLEAIPDKKSEAL